MQKLLTILTLMVIIAGCSDKGDRYSISDDVPPDTPIKLDHIEDATPKYEQLSLGGNRNYKLRGKSYKIIHSPEGFRQQGIASWYGKKFHGHLTANGEIYDMYSMSAAHKTLPIPSYVKVVNKDNGLTTIVRINDRGPFHEGRIIDLSYAAAHKLGVIKTGTAAVEIEYISIKPEPVTSAANGTTTSVTTLPGFMIQVASLNSKQNTRTLVDKLSQKFSVAAFIEAQEGKYRVILGPFKDYQNTEQTLQQVKTQGYPGAFIRKTE